MWDWHWWCSFFPTTLQKQPNQSLLLTTHQQNDAVCANCISFSAIARMSTSWLNRRRQRYLLLIICCPFLLPLFCLICPFVCAVEICMYMCRKRRKSGEDGRSRYGDGGNEINLLQRYLEDQLGLVLGSVYECGDGYENMEEEDGLDVQYIDSARPLLQ